MRVYLQDLIKHPDLSEQLPKTTPKVENVIDCSNYILRICFDNGEVRTYDISKWLKYPVFEPLKDEKFLASFEITGGSLTWSDNLDLSRSELYYNSVPI